MPGWAEARSKIYSAEMHRGKSVVKQFYRWLSLQVLKLAGVS